MPLLLGCWGIAFVTLAVALVLLNLYDAWIGNDLVLLTWGKEAALVGAASFVEGASLWLVATLVPGASRALIFPVLVVGLLYRVAHFQDWSRFDAFLLILFQFVICVLIISAYAGYFLVGLLVLCVFAGILALLGFFAKDL